MTHLQEGGTGEEVSEILFFSAKSKRRPSLIYSMQIIPVCLSIVARRKGVSATRRGGSNWTPISLLVGHPCKLFHKDYVFIPYSKAVGGVVVPADSPATSLRDLAGGKIGIAGGPLNKSWLILRAYAAQEFGMDLKADTRQVFGAPPLIFKSALGGDYAGAINFWHFLAKMKASGMKELISVEDAGQAMGLDTNTPLLGYYLKESFLNEHPDLAQSLYAASRDAKDLLANSPEAWEAIRPRMNAKSDAQFEQLKFDWIAGIPDRSPVDAVAANKMLELMAELGGAELVGEATSVPQGLFVNVE